MDVSDSQGDIVRPAAKNTHQPETPGGLHLGFAASSKPRVQGFVYSYQDYTWYDNRMRSFHNWPKTHPMRAQTLAGAGFHYTGEGDKVRCKWCDLELSQWEVFDSTLEQHKKHSRGDCNFLRQFFPRKSLQAIKWDCEGVGLTFNPEV